MPSSSPVVFFDIGDTLASATFIGGSLKLHRYEYIPSILNGLVSEWGATLGIISNSHNGNESPAEREAITAQVLDALHDAGLRNPFHPDLIFLSSQTNLRKSSPLPFELACGRAARLLGALPQNCLFVGENRRERRFGADAGMRVSLHPLLANEAIQGRKIIYVEVKFDDEAQLAGFGNLIQSLPVLPLRRTDALTAVCVTSVEVSRQLTNAGFTVLVPPNQPSPLFADLYLLREYSPATDTVISFAGGTASRMVQEGTDGVSLALTASESIDDYHVGHGHGHTVLLAPNPYLLRPPETHSGFASTVRDKLTPLELDSVKSLIDPDRIRELVNKYSGRDSSQPFITRNRHSSSPDMPKIIDALEADFESIGAGKLSVARHQFNHMISDTQSRDLENVIAELPGKTDEIVMITAHLDSTSQGTFRSSYDPSGERGIGPHDAPGADDDASGMAGVLNAAEMFCAIYRDEKPDRTIRFALFNAEEQGLVGSQHYAIDQRATGAKIVAVFQLDVMGYNVDPPAIFETHAGHPADAIQQQSRDLAEKVRTVAKQLQDAGIIAVELPQLFPETDANGDELPDPAAGRSDHASFQDRGYPGCVTSADFFPSHGVPAEANPNYHQLSDTVVDFDYAADIVRAVSAAALCYVSPQALAPPAPTVARPTAFAAAGAGAAAGAALVTIKGAVCAESDLEPIPSAVVELHRKTSLRDSSPVGRASCSAQGEFELRAELPAGASFSLVVYDSNGRLLQAGGETLVTGAVENWKVTLAVPPPPAIMAGATGAFAARAPRPTVSVNGQEFDVELLKSITPDDVLNEARNLVNPAAAVGGFAAGAGVLDRLANADPGFAGTAAQFTLCQTDRIETLTQLIKLSGRHDARDSVAELNRVLFAGAAGFATRQFLTPNFRITYQTTGSVAVDTDTSEQTVVDPGADPEVVLVTLPALPADDVPTYVRRIAFWLERSLQFYTSPPFSMKNPAARGRIQATINGGPFGGANPFGFFINNELPNDLICAVAVHELFHMSQFEYGGTGLWRNGLIEGGATFAEDSVADKMNRYLDEAGANFNGIGLLANPNQSLPSGAARYKTSLLWRYIAEQRSELVQEPSIGVDTYRIILEKCSAGTYSTSDIRKAVRAFPWDTEFDQFTYLDASRKFLTSSETTLGNFALACYLKELGDNVPDPRFDFLEDDEPIFINKVVPGAPQVDSLVSVAIQRAETLRSDEGVLISGSVQRFGSLFYEVDVEGDVDNVQVSFQRHSNLAAALFQMVLIDENDAVRDIIRSDMPNLKKRLTSVADGTRLKRLVLVVTGGEDPGSFQVSLTPADAAPDVMITRWNSERRKEHHIDSRNNAWTWVSPDLSLSPRTEAGEFDVRVRLHNKGNDDAAGINVSVECLDEEDETWKPIRSPNGFIQQITDESLPAGESNSWSLRWKPTANSSGNVHTLRASVESPADVNTDNKTAISRLGFTSFQQPDLIAFRLPQGANEVALVRRAKETPGARFSAVSMTDIGAGTRDQPIVSYISETAALRPETLPPGLERRDCATVRCLTCEGAVGYGATVFDIAAPAAAGNESVDER